MNIKTINTDTTLTGSEYTVIVEAYNNDVTIYLPFADWIVGKVYTIVAHYDNTHDVIVTPYNSGDKINGNSEIKLTAQEVLKIQSNGTEWFAIGGS